MDTKFTFGLFNSKLTSKELRSLPVEDLISAFERFYPFERKLGPMNQEAPSFKAGQLTDTDRLNYLLKFIFIDDVGDYDCAKGVVVKHEDMESELTSGPPVDGCMENLVQEWDDDLRDVINRAIVAHGFKL